MFSISKVEAVNRIMQALDGSIISTLDQPMNDTAIQAIRAIDTVTEKIQIENQWNFNFDGPRTLMANGDSQIVVPEDYLYIRILSWSNGSIWDLTVKAGKVWNRRQGTNIVPGTVSIGGSRLFSYTDCPAPVQNYIIEKAKFEYIGANVHLSAPRAALTAQSMKDAFQAAQKWDSEQAFGLMDLTPSIRDSFRRNGSNRGWWWGN